MFGRVFCERIETRELICFLFAFNYCYYEKVHVQGVLLLFCFFHDFISFSDIKDIVEGIT